VSFRLGAATAWAEAGHEVAWDQFVLSAPDSQLPPPVRLPRGVNMSGLRAQGSRAWRTGERDRRRIPTRLQGWSTPVLAIR
jgi:beta-galactosidase/beta-glucuronidase